MLVAGSATHFLLALVIFYIAGLTTGLPRLAAQDYDLMKAKPVVGTVSQCVVVGFDLTKDRRLRDCRAGDPAAPARAAGLQKGDRILAVGGTPVATYGAFVRAVRGTPPGTVEITYRRAGETRTTSADLVATQRPPIDDPGDTEHLATVSAIGLSQKLPRFIDHYGPVAAVGGSVSFLGSNVQQTFAAVGKFPSKIPKLHRRHRRRAA